MQLQDCCIATRNLGVWIAFATLRGDDLHRFENRDVSPLRHPNYSLPCLFFDRTLYCCIGCSNEDHCKAKIENSFAEDVADSVLLAQLYIVHLAGCKISMLAVGKEAGKSFFGQQIRGNCHDNYGNHVFSEASYLHRCFSLLDLDQIDLLVSFHFLPHCTIWRDKFEDHGWFWRTFLETIMPILVIICKKLETAGSKDALTSHLEQHKDSAWSMCRFGFCASPGVWGCETRWPDQLT